MTFLGIDLGTTSVKAAVFRPDGTRVAGASRPHPTHRPEPGFAEQHASDWWDGLSSVISSLSDALDGLTAVGVCSQVNTHVLCGSSGEALHPAITWQDRRCASVLSSLESRLSPSARADVRGGLGTIDVTHPAARLEWLTANRPSARDSARWLLSPKDLLVLWLTGTAAADPISSIGLVDASGTYPSWLDSLVPGLTALLPPLGDPAAVAGTTTGAGGLPPGLPVAHGTMDAWAGLLGGGVAGPGDAIDIAGTSEVVAMASGPGGGAPGIVTFPPWRDLHVHAGPTQAGGDALDWVARLLDRSLTDALALAASTGPGAGGVVFLPQLAGERAPLWDPHLRAHWIGATSETGPAELARAGLEGVAHAARHVLEAVESAGGSTASSLAVCGGGAASDLWCQVKADVLDRPLRRTAERDAGVLGAAMLGALAAGEAATIPELAARMVRTECEFVPDPAVRDLYDDAHARYREAQRRLSDLYVP
ncbi:xylulokinase [Pseudonocardia endophytica]|uniref:Xylulokinase n=1 Tax=Pseudonocardia endophytica TaxID=401976 RepID=A0A4R1HL04_PSEEN|nr:FGGY-family carbohydrate kinase [Pseudonocardia endophytica]TCK21185.1 xylulokinase [Pseudonocardia endophytica]